MWIIAKGSSVSCIMYCICINCLFRFESALKVVLLVWRVFRNSNSAYLHHRFNGNLYFAIRKWKKAIFLWQYDLDMNYDPKWENLCIYIRNKNDESNVITHCLKHNTSGIITNGEKFQDLLSLCLSHIKDVWITLVCDWK